MLKIHIIALMTAILYEGGSTNAAPKRTAVKKAYDLYDEVIEQSAETKAVSKDHIS